MRGPDGTSYQMENRFADIAAPALILVEHLQAGHEFTLMMTYTDEGAGTRLRWRMVFESAAEGVRVRPFVAAANEQNFDRLAAYLAAMHCPAQ